MERNKMNSDVPAQAVMPGIAKRIERVDLLMVILITVFVLLFNLGSGSLASWDEAIYARVSGEIIQSHNWFDLTWKGEAWSDKPPLYMWMTALFYKLFGINEFSARLFSALCGIGTVLIIYFFAKKLYSRNAAIASSLVLISTQHFIWSAKIGMLDCAFTFFMALSFFLFKLGEENRWCLFFSSIAFAGAFLTKGVGALLIPLILGIYMLFAGKLKLLKKPALWLGLVSAFLILIWWHWLEIAHYGKDFIFGYFTKHLFVRTSQSIDGHSGSIFNYLKVIPNKGRPWGAFLFLSLPFVFWKILAKKDKAHLLPLIWALTVFAVASLIKTKLHWYIIAIYPATSMLVGWGFSKIFKKLTIPVTFILALAALLYLAEGKKNIFNLDYSPEAKRIAQAAKDIVPQGDNVLLYKIGDPAMEFYCLEKCKNLPDGLSLEGLAEFKGKYIILEKKYFFDFQKTSHTSPQVIAQGETFLAFYSNP